MTIPFKCQTTTFFQSIYKSILIKSIVLPVCFVNNFVFSAQFLLIFLALSATLLFYLIFIDYPLTIYSIILPEKNKRPE